MPTQPTLFHGRPFTAIAAMARNRVIGAGNRIPWHLPEDFKWFKKMTTGHVIIMGRKTFESIGRPLPGRTTVILTRSGREIPGTITCPDWHRIDPGSPAFTGKTLFVCGGAEIYTQMLPHCADLYLTTVDRDVPGDTFFPPFKQEFPCSTPIATHPEFTIHHYTRLPS
ncbi:MAG: dihydrofolate reductase [Verrucomicrobiota bacterium]